jgi:hypothetical protein
MAVGSRISGLAVRAPLAARSGAGGRGRSHKALEWLDAVRETVCVITRLRLYVALYQPAPSRKPGQNGRPRKKGARLPTFAPVADDLVTD